jgi:hypothetical protein
LELFDVVLTRIGSNGLAQELHIWCPGFFALFQHAATNVKPRVLEVIIIIIISCVNSEEKQLID